VCSSLAKEGGTLEERTFCPGRFAWNLLRECDAIAFVKGLICCDSYQTVCEVFCQAADGMCQTLPIHARQRQAGLVIKAFLRRALRIKEFQLR
jgi:hypothetical protein